MGLHLRGHWGVETGLPGCLDLSFREDECRIRRGHAAENFARLSRIALNWLKAQTRCQAGIKAKRLCCGWSHDSLFRVLTQQDHGNQMRWPEAPDAGCGSSSSAIC